MKKPISSVYGEIKRMLLTYPETKSIPNDIILQRYLGIFHSLGNNIEYIILADQGVHSSIVNTAIQAGLDPATNLKLVPAFSNYPAFVSKIVRHVSGRVYECELESAWHTIWAQDGYSAIKKSDGSIVLYEPLDFTRGGDNFVAEQIAAVTDIEVESTKYHIQGGNILSGDDYIIVGSDYLEINKKLFGESELEITQGFRELFGVSEVIWLGNQSPIDFGIDVYQGKVQPIFHIDMYVTLAGKAANGKELVLVGDPRLAKSILDQPMPDQAIVDAFDETANYFRNYIGNVSFEVERLPLDLWMTSSNSGAFLTYNNCLIEVFGDTKNVYTPSYASVAPGSGNRVKLDSEVSQIFANLGFTTHLMEGAYEELCKRGGAIHCITKTIDRS